MGNKSAKTTNQMLGGQTERANQMSDQMRAFGAEDRGVSNDIRNFTLEKYKSLYDNGVGNLNSGGGGGGHVSAGALNLPGLRDNEALNTYRKFMGGGNPSEAAAMFRNFANSGGGPSGTAATLHGLMRTGGAPSETASTLHNLMRTGGAPSEAMGTYKNFMNTGGMSGTDIADFRRRASASSGGFYDSIKRNLNENAAIRGGGYGGFGSQLSKLAREKAQAADEAAFGAETNLASLLREGKLRGAEGVSGLERERHGRKMEGLSGYRELERDSHDRKMQGLSGYRGLERDNTDLRFQGAGALRGTERDRDDLMLRGAGGVEGLDREMMNRQESRAREDFENRKNEAAAANASRNAAAANRNASLRDQLAILGEMRGLRGESGSDLAYWDRASGNLGQGTNAINSRVAETPAWQTALGAVGGLAGAAVPFVGGGGFNPFEKKPKFPGSSMSDYTNLPG